MNNCSVNQESFAAAYLKHIVKLQVLGIMTDTEYNAAILYTMRKYHLKPVGTSIDLHGQDVDYISELVAEAIVQDRLSRGTLEIMKNDRELRNFERNETA